MKLCKKCDTVKPTDEFYKNKRSKDGLQIYCKECHRSSRRDYYRQNKEKILKANKLYKIENASRVREANDAYFSKNAELIRERARKRREEKRELIRVQERARCAKRKAVKLQRTPPWSETEAINEFYANCPEGYHVDHIIPLQGETVSGLHVRKNLQYLPAGKNMSKRNAYTPEIWLSDTL